MTYQEWITSIKMESKLIVPHGWEEGGVGIRLSCKVMRRGWAQKLSKETLGREGQGFGDTKEGMEEEMRGKGGRGPRA